MANVNTGKVFYKDLKPYEKTGGSCSGTTQESLDDFFSHIDIWCADDLRGEWRYYETSSDGYVFEWKGDLWVDLNDARLLKCKNKDKTKIHEIETDDYGFAYFNDYAVTNGSWNRLYFHEIGFAMYVGDSYQYKETTPLNDSYIKLVNEPGGFVFHNDVVAPNMANITINNYRIKGKRIQGLAHLTNRKKTNPTPYCNKDGQELLGNGTKKTYYWDMVPHQENFIFASNFYDLISSDKKYRISIKDEYVHFDDITDSSTPKSVGKLPVEWLPYLVISIKYINNTTSDFSTYAFGQDPAGYSSFPKNMFAITQQTTGSGYPHYTMHLIGKDMNDEKSTINIQQSQKLLHLWVKSYPGTEVELTKTYCKINNIHKTWAEWVQTAKESDNVADLLFSKESYEHDLDFSSIDNVVCDERGYDSSGREKSRMIVRDRGGQGWYPGTSSGNVVDFSGFNVKISGSDYKIKEMPPTATVIGVENEGFDWTYFTDALDITIGEDTSLKAMSERDKWNGSFVSISSFQHKIEGYCGCFSKEIFLTKAWPDVFSQPNSDTPKEIKGYQTKITFSNKNNKMYDGEYFVSYGCVLGGPFAAQQYWTGLMAAKIGFRTDSDSYGWAVSATSDIYETLDNDEFWDNNIPYKWKDRTGKTITYTLTNNSGLKKRIRIKYTDGSISQGHDFMPYEEKDISCNVGSTQTKLKEILWEEIL